MHSPGSGHFIERPLATGSPTLYLVCFMSHKVALVGPPQPNDYVIVCCIVIFVSRGEKPWWYLLTEHRPFWIMQPFDWSTFESSVKWLDGYYITAGNFWLWRNDHPIISTCRYNGPMRQVFGANMRWMLIISYSITVSFNNAIQKRKGFSSFPSNCIHIVDSTLR